MRLLHTADWHLGRSLHGEPLLAHQAAFLDFLVATAREQAPDAILLAGDVFDRALPPAEAVRLAGDALTRLAEVAPVIAIPGNHDSAQRLGFAGPLLSKAGLHVRTDAARCGEAIPIGDAAIYALPYLEPDVVRSLLGCEERGHEAVLGAAMDAVRRDLAGRPAGTRCVVVAHAFVAGGVESESERDLSVGGAGCVPPSVFAGAHYVALGHLHGPQAVGPACRYAGSPLAYSFSEAHHEKSVALVELDAGGTPTVTTIACPVPRPLATLRGELDVLLSDPALAVHEHAWVQATITDPVRPLDAMPRLQRRFPHAVVLAFEPHGERPGPTGTYAARLAGLDDTALVERFVEDVRGEGPDDAERALVQEVLDAQRVREAVG